MDLNTCTVEPCSSDGDCAGQHCFDVSPFIPATACCDACMAPPCNAVTYCRCNDDDFAPGCTTDGDCPAGMLCKVMDASPTNSHCYHPTCTDTGGCNDANAACDAACTDLGGTFATFCMDTTCVGGVNDGQLCKASQVAAECPGGACTGPQECNCTTTTTATTTTTTTTTTLVATVTVGPRTCAGGSNNGTECFHDANCTGGGTCTGAAHTTFLDQVSGNSTTTVAAGTRVDFVWLATGVNHDIAGGTECTNGGTSGSPTNRACDPGDGVCVGGSNVNGNCGSDPDCPGGTCDLNKECRYCTGGANDGHLCPFDLGCTGGGTCSHTSTCTNTLADTWDAGGSFMAPHTTSHLFTIAGTYPYVCSIHYNASTPMLGTVVVTP